MIHNIMVALFALGSVWIITCFAFVFGLVRAASKPTPHITFADQLEQQLPAPRNEGRVAAMPAQHEMPEHGGIHSEPIHAHAMGSWH
ncbi:MAG: hypothetical protein EXS31_02015 [Pedosphaera sp.]|nr:hypothetical protein [Pedosphaera sp.]